MSDKVNFTAVSMNIDGEEYLAIPVAAYREIQNQLRIAGCKIFEIEQWTDNVKIRATPVSKSKS